ncbi:glycosyltransferase [Candidatus Wolfebacteria bacterium]|nr:glycosyltransferase [Candidatus Wolfebacteria bacterium]
MFKILIISSSTKWDLGRSYLRGFSILGAEAEIFDEQKFYKENSFLASNRYGRRLFWRFLAGPLQKEILKTAKEKRPDLILVFKGWLIKPQTISDIKKILPQTLVFNFNPDNPFNTWHHGNSNYWIINSIPLYDVYFIWGKFLVEPLKKAGAKAVEYLPFGYDSKIHYPAEVSKKDREVYGSDIAFIGTWDKEREWWLNNLITKDSIIKNLNLKIWGNLWEKANKKLQEKWQKKEMVGEEFSRVCGASKIILNFIRKQNGSSHNMRTFEIPACRGFMLSNRTSEQIEFFKEGKEAEYFSNAIELKEKINYYLKNDELRNQITIAGYEKLIKSGYSYMDRAKKIINIYKEING